MKITQVLWDADSIYHIAKHKVTPEEVEEALFEGYSIVFKARGKQYTVLSQSISGRYLMTVIAFKLKGRVRIITARDMDKRERKYYTRKGK